MSERKGSRGSAKATVQLRRKRKRDGSDRALYVNSIEKAVVVLNAFSRERPRLTHVAITRLTGLEKSAVQRFLYTLHALGLLRKNEETKQYSLSPRLLEFAYAYTYSDGLIERAQPFLVDAHERTDETVNLFVLEDADIILVSRIPGRHVVTMNIQVGFRMPALYSASGRVIASRLDSKERNRLLRQTRYQSYTPHSVTDADEMAGLIDKAAKDGFALAQSQFFQGDVSVAAPIVDGANNVLGAISISAPDTSMSLLEAREKLVPVVLESARKLSLAMGAY